MRGLATAGYKKNNSFHQNKRPKGKTNSIFFQALGGSAVQLNGFHFEMKENMHA